MEAKLKHLEMIQGVINRLASDSFRIKGWTVVLVAALIAVLTREGRIDFSYVAFLPVLLFWGLDGYFLWQERRFRALYDFVRVKDESEIDYSMDIRLAPTARKRTWFGATFSITLILFYVALVIAIGVMSIIGGYRNETQNILQFSL